MKRSTALTVFGMAVTCFTAGLAFAATGCSTAPASQWQAKAKLESRRVAQGMTVRRIKTEGGCYEVYAKGKSGKNQNQAFNAQTLKQLANAEAGEN